MLEKAWVWLQVRFSGYTLRHCHYPCSQVLGFVVANVAACATDTVAPVRSTTRLVQCYRQSHIYFKAEWRSVVRRYTMTAGSRKQCHPEGKTKTKKLPSTQCAALPAALLNPKP